MLVLSHPLYGQLDTIYFDDFVDNRHQWPEYEGEKGSQAIRDGYMDATWFLKSGTTRFNYFTAPIPNADTFLYEIKILPETMRFGGAMYDLCHLPRKKTSQYRLCQYSALVADRKGFFCFLFSRNGGGISPNITRKMPELQRDSLTFRLTYGSGKYYCHLNGEQVASYRFTPPRRHPKWQKWGWLMKGYSKFKVDYVLLLARPKIRSSTQILRNDRQFWPSDASEPLIMT